jgi:predicted phage terminase large subunit-like protein
VNTRHLGVAIPEGIPEGSEIMGPQPGPQTDFLASPADIVIFGGGRGGGKSIGLILDPVRYVSVPGFNAVIFRRTRPQITMEGGLWLDSAKIYPSLGAYPRETQLDWRWPEVGSSIRFAHLEHAKNLQDWLGAQIAYIGFDQLEAFTEFEFFYLLACNRSTCGVEPCVRATCNPDPDSWLRRFLSWWIDEETGYPIVERSGVLRWFVRLGDDSLRWFDSKEDGEAAVRSLGLDPRDNPPTSVTFIRSLVDDNPALLEINPQYVGRLNTMAKVERERFRHGNWNARPTAGTVFQRGWFVPVEVAPTNVRRRIRYWDRAATEVSAESPDPDWTVGMRVALLDDGRFVIEHAERMRATSAKVEARIKNLGWQEKPLRCKVGLERDPAAAGKSEANYLTRQLRGLDVAVIPASGDKLTRALPASAQAEQGNVLIVSGEWNDAVLRVLEAFDGSEKGHDDDVDALSGAVNALCDDELWKGKGGRVGSLRVKT